MLRNTTFTLLAVLGVAASSQAGVILSHDAGTPTTGLSGFTTYTVTASSDVAGEAITGVDFYGSGADGAATARGFFGPMNQLVAGPFTTVFKDFDAFLPQPNGPLQDSRFLFSTSGTGAVNSPAGFSGESGNSLRALFSRAGGFGESIPLAQLVLPDAAAGEVSFKGTFSVLRDGVNVTLPEITGVIPMGGPIDMVNILTKALGPRSNIFINEALTADASGPVTWSNLTPAAGSAAIAATLSPTGDFSWDTTGSARGPHGSGVLYSWTATAMVGTATDTDIAISLQLEIPEPATMSLLGLAMIGLVGLFGRKRA